MSDQSTGGMDRTSRLSMGELDYLCAGFGTVCIRCKNDMEGCPRVCPSVSNTEIVHSVARSLHADIDREDSS